jgi:hypothetical protein
MASWAKHNPAHRLLLFGDSNIKEYIETYSSKDTLALLHELATPVEKSDLWRYLVLCFHGGVYADTDTVTTKPIQEWGVDGASAVLSMEGIGTGNPNKDWDQLKLSDFYVVFLQWMLTARPGHPIFCATPTWIRSFMDEEAAKGERSSIVQRTGPGLITMLVRDHLDRHNASWGDYTLGGMAPGGLQILNHTEWGCSTKEATARATAGEVVGLVYHHYRGIWRHRSPSCPSGDCGGARKQATQAQHLRTLMVQGARWLRHMLRGGS